MKKPTLRQFIAAFQISSLLLALCVSGLNVSAADKKSALSSVKIKNDAVIAVAKSVSDGQNGALITWETSFEAGNLGFNLYRTGNSGEAVLVNQTLIAGSAFTVGDKRPLYGGGSYSFFDADGTPDSEYSIETVLVSGKRTSFALRSEFTAEVLAVEQYQNTNSGGKFWEQPVKDDSKPSDFTVGSTLADADRQRWVAAQPGVKIFVKSEGLYRVTRQQLVDAGFDVNVPVAFWQLYTDGIEQTIRVSGAPNGVLDATGFIEFFGYGYDSTYTDARTYFLVAGSTVGKRMNFIEGRGYPNPTPAASYRSSTQCKTTIAADCNKPTFYFFAALNGETENFYGSLIFNATTTPLRLNIPFLDAASTQDAVLDVSLQGFTANNHEVRVTLNGNLLGTVTGAGQALMQRSFTVPHNALTAGENTVLLVAANSGDTTLVNYVRLDYSRRYNVASGKLLFPTVYRQAVKVDGFSSQDYRVFDVTDVNNVGIFNHRRVEENGVFSAVVATVRPRLMYAVTDSAVMTPAAITANIPSNLYNTAQNKDLLIVTYKDWKTQAETLAAYRQSQGLSVAVVDVEDVFDEFSFGTSLPDGVRAFFQRAAPDYALLLGDANIDPKNYLGRPSWIPNYVPTFHRDSAYGEIVTDENFGDFLDDSGNPGQNFVSEFPVGRLPARDAAGAQAMIDKIISFEQNLPANGFTRGAVFINDDPIDYNFFATNQNMAGRLPAGTAVQHIQRNGATSTTADPVRTAIVNAVNQGPLIVGYAGHGSLNAWSSASIMRLNEVNQLTNGANGRYSIFFLLTCLSGAFADFNSDSLSEAAVRRPNGGAVVAWSSSGLTVAAGQDVMGEKFYDLYRQAGAGTRIGDLTKPARLHSFDPDVRASWTLLGDPTLKVR